MTMSATSWRRRALLSALVLGAAAAALAPSAEVAHASELEAGLLVGGNRNYLTTPNDPVGTYTFLWGSNFVGMGVTAGATAAYPLMEPGSMALMGTADLLYGYHRGAGFARHEASGGQIDVTLSTHVVRLPLMVHLATSRTSSSPRLGLGVEPIVGMMSSSTIELTDVNAQVRPVDTTPTMSAALLFGVGFDLRRDGMTIPIDFRVAYNPFVASSSEERFEGFASREEPGELRLTFDWQFMVSTGARWGL